MCIDDSLWTMIYKSLNMGTLKNHYRLDMIEVLEDDCVVNVGSSKE